MAKWSSRVLLAGNGVLLAILLYRFGITGLSGPTAEFEYKDLITILLTAIAVLLGVVTIFVAGLAIWGYTAIREAAEMRAEAISKSIAASVARDTAQAVALRETPNAVRLYLATTGQGGDGDAADVDALTRALQEGAEGGGGE